MTKVDLHCHSKYSDVPSTWVLKAYDSPESFTEPELLYQQAKARGMDLVTITDHDDIRGCIELQRAHPDDTFISCELTAWFPEDGCKVHILVYGIDQAQYRCMMQLRSNLYDLRDYIVRQQIAHSVAHASYDQDGKLQFSHIEKLVLLFDNFEVINGGSGAQNNILVHRYLQSLDAEQLTKLHSRYAIEPIGPEPWRKGFTGGSDDHCGILTGSAFTQSHCSGKQEFLQSLRQKETEADGLHGSFEIYATGVVKHIHDYRGQRDAKYHKSKMNDFLEMFFAGDEGNWAKRFKKSQSLRVLKRKNSRTHQALHVLLEQINRERDSDIADKIPLAYTQVAKLHDEMFRSVVKALAKNLPEGNIFKTFQHLSTLFPMMLLAAPFVGSMRHQVLKAEIKSALISACKQNYTHKALWFTDTIDDLNGVSVSLRQIAHQSDVAGYQLSLVTCVDENDIHSPLPDGAINLHPVYRQAVPGYEQQEIGFPSMLALMRRVILEQPDQIVISTPGPLGLGALMCAKLMDLPVKAVYHTDFAEQIRRITNEAMAANVVEAVTNAFYRMADQVYVPSQSYINKLNDAGIEREKMFIFPRGLDVTQYRPAASDVNAVDLLRRHQLHGGYTLLFAGRISEDKNLSLLAEIVEIANQQNPDRYNLVIAGDGPYLGNLKQRLGIQPNVFFTGRLDAQELIEWYQSVDLLVFPSHTDTFGMVVLEAQACGVPCLVTASGGPKEIIDNNVTGEVIYTDEAVDWYAVIQSYFRLANAQPQQLRSMRQACVSRVRANNSWQSFFAAVLGEECRRPKPSAHHFEPAPSDSSQPDHSSKSLAA